MHDKYGWVSRNTDVVNHDLGEDELLPPEIICMHASNHNAKGLA